MKNTANISAVILVKNAEKTIAECLESLRALAKLSCSITVAPTEPLKLLADFKM